MITRKQDVYGSGQLKENTKMIKIGGFFPSEKSCCYFTQLFGRVSHGYNKAYYLYLSRGGDDYEMQRLLDKKECTVAIHILSTLPSFALFINRLY